MLSSSAVCFTALVLTGQGQLGEGYLHELRTVADFDKLSASSIVPGVDRSTKFLVPAIPDDPSLLPVVFQNVNKYKFHSDFMAAEFPDRFPGLSGPEYLALAERRATRKYFAALLYRFGGEPVQYGFDIFTGDEPAELPLIPEVKWVYDQLLTKFSLGPVAYTPRNTQAIRNAETWQDPGFPVNFFFGGGFGDYLPYVLTENYGRVRVLDPEEFREANDTGEISAQNILVLSEAPSDIEGVIAGLITAAIQDELSHASIRMARRGTPNAFVKDAPSVFAPYEGKIVRLKIGQTGHEVTEATLAEAQAWWATHKLPPIEVPALDRDYDKLDSAAEIPGDGSLVHNGKYGGKGANFGRLWHLLTPDFPATRDNGFVVPMHYYFEYVSTQRVASYENPLVRVSLAEYIDEMLADPAFQADSKKRFEDLGTLRELFEDGDADPALVASIAARIAEVFGATDQKVRFRSSSNAEHLLEFNGAGIYESSSACAADDLDVGTGGPSRCDSAEPRERGIGRALKRVWGSLWSFRGFEEREFYSIPHSAVGMAILCSESFGDNEKVNAVAFTGNPTDAKDGRFLINCQAGDIEVVDPPPGVESEQNLLRVDAAGVVTEITRVRASNQLEAGQLVLSDDQLREAGRILRHLHTAFPFDPKGIPSERILRDVELKIDGSGQLRFKDIRLFVIPEASQPRVPDLKVVVPEDMVLCSGFWENRPAPYILRRKMKVGLKAGTHIVTTGAPVTLFEWLQVGEDGERLQPLAATSWTKGSVSRRLVGEDYASGFDFEGHIDFLHQGEQIRVSFDTLFLRADVEETVLDGPALTFAINPHYIRGTLYFGDPPDDSTYLTLLPCDLTHLPRQTTEIQFIGGDAMIVEERFQDLMEGTGPAEIQLAEITLSGETRLVTSFWRLVYTAGHHNDTPYPEFWALFDEPWEVPGVEVPVHGVQIVQGGRQAPLPPEAYLLAEDHTRIVPLLIQSLTRRKEGVNPLLFRRGDFDNSGAVNITDAILILRWLFQEGGLIDCPDALDVDDLGSIEITDAILVLEWLYLGGDEPAPPGPFLCGEDDLLDEQPDCSNPGCN